MRSLENPLRKGKRLRTIGFDDAPFSDGSELVSISGVICSKTRFEGMVWGDIEKDGLDVNETICQLLAKSKFLEQLNLLLTDGITFGGFNVVDLPYLAGELQIPCIALMRRHPDLPKFFSAMEHVDRRDERKRRIEAAGPIHEQGGFFFQVAGCEVDQAALALQQVTDTGDVPEPLRLAHLIGAAVKLGESGKRA